jgi:hypothetical protein
MSGAIHPLPQYVFMACCLVKHRDNFTFTLHLFIESYILFWFLDRNYIRIYYACYISHFCFFCDSVRPNEDIMNSLSLNFFTSLFIPLSYIQISSFPSCFQTSLTCVCSSDERQVAPRVKRNKQKAGMKKRHGSFLILPSVRKTNSATLRKMFPLCPHDDSFLTIFKVK